MRRTFTRYLACWGYVIVALVTFGHLLRVVIDSPDANATGVLFAGWCGVLWPIFWLVWIGVHL